MKKQTREVVDCLYVPPRQQRGKKAKWCVAEIVHTFETGEVLVHPTKARFLSQMPPYIVVHPEAWRPGDYFIYEAGRTRAVRFGLPLPDGSPGEAEDRVVGLAEPDEYPPVFHPRESLAIADAISFALGATDEIGTQVNNAGLLGKGDPFAEMRKLQLLCVVASIALPLVVGIIVYLLVSSDLHKAADTLSSQIGYVSSRLATGIVPPPPR